MTEPDLVAALAGIFGERVFPDTAPPGAPRPFAIYQQIGGAPSNTLRGNTNRENAVVQVWVWCDPPPAGGGRAQANTLMRAAERVLTAAPFYGVSQGSLGATHDEGTGRYGARQDFSFWWRREQ